MRYTKNKIKTKLMRHKSINKRGPFGFVSWLFGCIQTSFFFLNFKHKQISEIFVEKFQVFYMPKQFYGKYFNHKQHFSTCVGLFCRWPYKFVDTVL